MATILDPQQALDRLARTGLAHASEEDVVRVAQALWHEAFEPELGQLAGPHVRDAAYLVDRLARFAVVPRERKQRLLARLPAQPPAPQPSAAGGGLVADARALAWRASGDLARFWPRLLPLQTRHHRL